MTDALNLAFALIAGILLGAFFFGGLWWTVRRAVTSESVALWIFGSMLLRTSVVMLGFYYSTGNSWQRLLACLLGFVLARLIATRLSQVTVRPAQFRQEADHAP